MSILLDKADAELRAANYPQLLSLLCSLAHERIGPDCCDSILALWQAIPDGVRNEWAPKKIRIAIIGSATVALKPLLEVFLGLKKLQCEFWDSGYQIDNILHMRDAELAAFRPDICLLQTGLADIQNWPELAAEPDAYNAALLGEARRWSDLADGLRQWLGCEIIFDAFPPFTPHPLGAVDSRLRGGRARYIKELNSALLEILPPKIRWHDQDIVAASVGSAAWRDARLWHHAKFAIAPAAAPAYAFSLASMIGAMYQATKKCLVLDLDNTLWGGVIGDDGPDGIVFGEGSGEGEAFKAFQAYIKLLKRQGVLLAVCSKNELATAQQGFSGAEALLKLADFDAFVANWERKSANILAIASELNIGVSSLAFFDDNPVEREEVRFGCPGVLVIDVPEDPAFYVEALDAYRAFEPAALTSDDLERADFYRNERSRDAFAATVTDYDDYLRGLEMEAVIQPFRPGEMPRISQLINKTNQFNLTTRRYSEAECEKFLDPERYLTRYIRLKDRFGNHGLIAVFIAEHGPDNSLIVDSWLMSCRVLKRGVEQALMANILREAEARKVSRIVGRYIPTKANGMVKSLYKDLGFAPISADGQEECWELRAPFSPAATFISEADA
jgi:FkbH-like protein